jgi:hypothetical protein
LEHHTAKLFRALLSGKGLANPVASCVGQWYKMIGSLELPRPRLDDTSSFQSIDIGDSGSGRVAVFHRFPPLWRRWRDLAIARASCSSSSVGARVRQRRQTYCDGPGAIEAAVTPASGRGITTSLDSRFSVISSRPPNVSLFAGTIASRTSDHNAAIFCARLRKVANLTSSLPLQV